MEEPKSIMTGKPVFEIEKDSDKKKSFFFNLLNKVLCYFRLPSF